MTIRPATIGDILPIIALMDEALTRSIYAGVDEVDHEYTRKLFARSLHFHGNSNHQATLIYVSEMDGKVAGYFFGFLDRLYQVGKKLAATEVHFYLAPWADQRDALKLLNAFLEWAEANPKVVEIRLGESNILGEPDPRFAKLLERKGFHKAATLFTKRIER